MVWFLLRVLIMLALLLIISLLSFQSVKYLHYSDIRDVLPPKIAGDQGQAGQQSAPPAGLLSTVMASSPASQNVLQGQLYSMRLHIQNIISKVLNAWLNTARSIQSSLRSIVSAPSFFMNITRFSTRKATTELINTKSISDHIAINIETLPSDQQQRIASILSKIYNHSTFSLITAKAKELRIEINEHLVFRYFSAVNGAPLYNELPYEDAIMQTILWKHSFYAKLNLQALRPLLQTGIIYTSDQLDAKQRAVMYFKTRKYGLRKGETLDTYSNALMYTVDRAEKMSLKGSGEFVMVIDLHGFSWQRCPSLTFIKQVLGLLKKHYPYRLAGVYIVNSASAFNLLWRLLLPFIPRKIQSKVLLPSHKEQGKVLFREIGEESLEREYGGRGENTEEIMQSKEGLEEYLARG